MTTMGNAPGIQAVGIPVTDQDRALRSCTDTRSRPAVGSMAGSRGCGRTAR
jgi:hypothetical protein